MSNKQRDTKPIIYQGIGFLTMKNSLQAIHFWMVHFAHDKLQTLSGCQKLWNLQIPCFIIIFPNGHCPAQFSATHRGHGDDRLPTLDLPSTWLNCLQHLTNSYNSSSSNDHEGGYWLQWESQCMTKYDNEVLRISMTYEKWIEMRILRFIYWIYWI